MDWNTIALATITALFIIGLTLIALADEDEETPKTEISDFFTEEELALIEFLETRQAINEDFLVAQKKLLETLNHERRHF